MKKHIPYEKLSKRARREEDKRKRVVWIDMGVESPATRVAMNRKAYSRARMKQDLPRV